jgi:glycosyltransferase involved in cell wall biosynthesis
VQTTGMNLPWITCVCVSAARPSFIRRAIRHFKVQTYPHKDLVIVYEGDYEFLIHDTLPDVKLIKLPAGSELSLGERRNISIQHCKGDYFCHWDDDDWYHSRRLEFQMGALVQSGRSACVLKRLLLYDALTHRAFLSSERYWEGTLLCRTDLINDATRYPHVNRSEDNSLVVSLVRKEYVHALSTPYLYAYLFHGTNTWEQAHFNQLFQAGYPLDETAKKVMKEIFFDDVGADASEKVQRLNLDVLLPGGLEH